jgi:hypothetical protein
MVAGYLETLLGMTELEVRLRVHAELRCIGQLAGFEELTRGVSHSVLCLCAARALAYQKLRDELEALRSA